MTIEPGMGKSQDRINAWHTPLSAWECNNIAKFKATVSVTDTTGAAAKAYKVGSISCAHKLTHKYTVNSVKKSATVNSLSKNIMKDQSINDFGRLTGYPYSNCMT